MHATADHHDRRTHHHPSTGDDYDMVPPDDIANRIDDLDDAARAYEYSGPVIDEPLDDWLDRLRPRAIDLGIAANRLVDAIDAHRRSTPTELPCGCPPRGRYEPSGRWCPVLGEYGARGH
jgi:hypothetical protein